MAGPAVTLKIIRKSIQACGMTLGGGARTQLEGEQVEKQLSLKGEQVTKPRTNIYNS